MHDAILQRNNRFTWALLAMQGGFVNVGGWLSLHKFVSHVTGFAAHFSTELVAANYIEAFLFVLVPVFFLIGAFFSAIFTEVRRKRGQSPIYIQILTLLSGLYGGSALLGYLGGFGAFGGPFNNLDFILLSILSFSCGAQNALFTHYSGSIIRTTHLTGITTDLGIGLAKVLITQDHKEHTINKLRIELIVSFLLGSLLSALLFPRLQYIAFLIPALVSALVGLRLLRSRVVENT